MKIIVLIAVWVTLILSNKNIVAQSSLAKTWEIGLKGGTSNYKGDLSFKFIERTQFRWSGGIFAQYNISKRFSSRLAFNALRIEDDDITDTDLGRRYRLANFRNDIYEGAFTFQFHILRYGFKEGKYFVPTLFAGVAVFKHNPMARITLGIDSLTGEAVYYKQNGEDVWIPLQPIGTEGQTATQLDPEFPDRTAPKQYSLWQFAIPMGLSLNFIAGKSWIIGAEFCARMTFTDYIDDVSAYYYDRSNYFQAVVDANPIIKGKAGGNDVSVPLTITDYYGGSHNTAALLAAPSMVLGGPTNDSYSFPDARRGDINRDWYFTVGLKISKAINYKKAQANIGGMGVHD